MVKRPWVSLCLALFMLALGACGRTGLQDEAPEVSLNFSVQPDPPLFGRPCQLSFTLLDDQQKPIDGALFTVEGDMTHAGMVPVVVEFGDGQEGVYLTSFEWSMAGDWVLTVMAELPDGRVARRVFDITVQLPGG